MLRRHRTLALILPVFFGAVATKRAPDNGDAATTAKVLQSRVAAVSNAKTTSSVAGLHLVVAPSGNEARYRIREELVGMDFPNDAIGRTSDVTGGIGVGTDGTIIPGESKFVINVATLKSDRDRRDGFVRGRVLETDRYPAVEFAPTAVRGLPKKLPTSGAHTFDIIGNLTVRGVTRPTTWHVTAESKNGQVAGNAKTLFTFSDFKIDQPRVPVLLSVQDTIRLEYDFRLVPKG